MDFGGRRRRLRERLARLRMDGMLVTHMPDVRYLSGFTGSAGVLAVSPRSAALFTDGRYAEQARAEAAGVRVVIPKVAALRAAIAWIARSSARRVAFDADHVTVAAKDVMDASLPKDKEKKRLLHGISSPVARLRMVKDATEVARIRTAVELGSSLFEVALAELKPGVPEANVAAAMEFAARRRGAEGMSFETIVAGGARSALPHGVASPERLPRRGFVVLDFGVIVNGYCSDMTRTVFLGRPRRADRALYDAVLEAQQAAIESIRPGATAGDVDRAARSVLERAKLGRYFTHSTGHGVGLEIHEAPRVARNQPEPLESDMVLTVEPGVYVPGTGGVRIEDMVVVTERGCEVLTPTPKAWLSI